MPSCERNEDRVQIAPLHYPHLSRYAGLIKRLSPGRTVIYTHPASPAGYKGWARLTLYTKELARLYRDVMKNPKQPWALWRLDCRALNGI